MQVSVRWYGLLRIAVGARESQIELPEGTTLGEMAGILKGLYGERVGRLLGGEPPFHYLRVLVNGRDHFTLGGLQTILVAGDVITLMPPLVGG